MEQQEQTPREVVGENVRRIREAAGARQEDVATAARGMGLSWTRSKVAALERGDKSLDLAETVLLAEAIGEVAGQPVSLSDLFAGAGAVRLSRKMLLTRDALRRFVGDEPVQLLLTDVPDQDVWIQAAIAGVQAATEAVPAKLERMRLLAGPGVAMQTLVHAEAVVGEVEERAGRSLGLSKVEVAWLSVRLWGRTLGEERDARVTEDVPTATRSAMRGRVTRELVKELRARLEEVSNVQR